MIETDCRDGGGNRLKDVRCIQPPAKPNFTNRNLDVGTTEQLKRRGRRGFADVEHGRTQRHSQRRKRGRRGRRACDARATAAGAGRNGGERHAADNERGGAHEAIQNSFCRDSIVTYGM